jgi:hypothetical protein
MIGQIPVAPTSMVMPSGANLVIAALNYTLLLIVAVVMGRAAWKTRSALPLLCLAGGALACLMEPIYDVMICVWYPQYGQTPLLRDFGISVPLWILPAYAWYISGQGYYMYRKFQAGISAPRLWMFYVLFYVSDLALEAPGLVLHIYAYYGAQPLEVLGLPLWMASANAVMPILLGITYKSLEPVLRGPAMLMALPLVPTIIGCAQISTSWPVWFALHSGQGLGCTSVASFITIGLSVMIAYLAGRLYCAPAERFAPLSRI